MRLTQVPDTPASLMLFAAGFGHRMRPLTDDRPKPLIEVAGRSLLDHALAQRSGLALTCVVNAHYRADEIAAHVAGRDIALSREDGEILETGGGLRHALPLLGAGPVFALNTDAVWHGPAALPLLAEAWDPARMDGLLLCVPRDRARGHRGQGDFLLDTEGRATPGPGLVYTGAQILRTELLSEIAASSFSVWELWKLMMARGTFHATTYPGLWCDVGQPESIALAEEMLHE